MNTSIQQTKEGRVVVKPRGFGERGIVAESNVGKEMAEELRVRVVKTKLLGLVVANSDCGK